MRGRPGTPWRRARERRQANQNGADRHVNEKIHSQPNALVMTPSDSVPAAAPLPAIPPRCPRARLRSRPTVNVVARIDSAAGEQQSAAEALRGANAMPSNPSDQAKPHVSDAPVKMARPVDEDQATAEPVGEAAAEQRKAAERIAYAVSTHCRLSLVKLRSVRIDGNATFTMAMSRTMP